MNTYSFSKYFKIPNPDDHGTIFNSLVYTSIFWTIFLITFVKPHRFYKNIISWVFNLSFNFRKSKWKIYHVLILISIFFMILLACKYF